MNHLDRWQHAIRVAQKNMPVEVAAHLSSLLRWETLGAAAGYVASRAVGLGFIGNGLMLGHGLVEVRRAARQLRAPVATIQRASSLFELEDAGREMARVVAPLLLEAGVASATASASRIARASRSARATRAAMAPPPTTRPATAESVTALLGDVRTLMQERWVAPRRHRLPQPEFMARGPMLEVATPAHAAAQAIARIGQEMGIPVRLERRPGHEPTLIVDVSRWNDGSRSREEAFGNLSTLFNRIQLMAGQRGFPLRWRPTDRDHGLRF